MLGMASSTISSDLFSEIEEPYPFARIWVNGRHIFIDKILNDKQSPATPFEESIFEFIKAWMGGQESFSLSTSGSTGTPKTITVTRDQMRNSALLTKSKLGLRKNSTALLSLDPKYIAGKMMLVRSLLLGFKIMAVDPTSNPLIKIPVDKCVQFTAFVPYQVHSILESKHPHLLNNLDKVLIGGAPLDSVAREKLNRFQCECYETYGMTETVSHVALRLINTNMKQQYFEALPGVSFSLDERGCLIVKADHLGQTVVTNDLVELIDDSKFVWLGRWDNVINTGGVKVMPEKVEQQLETIFARNNFPHRFFIAAVPDDKLGQKVVLIIEGVQISSQLLKSSLDELKSILSPFEFPKEIYSIPTFPTTDTQKIDRIQTIAKATLLPFTQ